MSIKEYLLESLNNDELLVRELINIDNIIQNKSITYEEILRDINLIEEKSMLLVDYIDALTDGETLNVFRVIINAFEYLDNLYVDKNNLGLYSWVVNILNNYYGYNVNLDTTSDYHKYNGKKILVSGSFEFNTTMKLELDKSTIVEI